jgi:CRP-like cAMP-binding protein
MTVLRAYRQLLRNGPLTRLLVGEFVSSIGDWLYLVAILILVYQVTEDPFILGLVGAARVLPYLILSIPAGIVADRFDRRLVLFSTDVARGLLMLVIAGIVALDGPIWLVIALAIGGTCFATFFGPAIGAYLPTLVEDEDQLGPANSAWSTLDNLAFMIGPAVAGILIAVGGLVVAFLLNAASFAVIAVILWGLPRSRPAAAEAPITAAAPGGPALGGPALGRGVLVPVIGLAIIDIVGSIAGGGISVLTVVIATTSLGGGEAATGFLNAGIGLGGLIGALIAGALVLRPSLAPVLAGGSALLAVGLAGLGYAPALGVAIAAIAVASVGGLVVEVTSTTIFQRIVPDAIRGRALGILGTISTVAFAAGSFILPVASGAVGTGPVLLATGIAVAAAGVVGALMAAPAARRRAGSTADVRVTRLAGLPLFAGVPAATLEAVAVRLEPVRVAAGDMVIRQGDPADRFYLIEDGAFEVTRRARPAQARGRPAAAAMLEAVAGKAVASKAVAGEPAATTGGPAATTGEPVAVMVDASAVEHLRTMGPGEVFGEIGLLRGVPRTATVTAATDGTLLALDGADFLQLVSSGPLVGPRLLDLRRGAPGAGY